MSDRKLIQKFIELPWAKIYEYLINQYIKNKLLTNDNKKYNYLDGFIKRIMAIWSIKSYFHVSNDPHIIVFKLNDLEYRTEINYGFLFAFDLRKIPKDIYDMLYSAGKKYIYGNYGFMHFSFGPSMISCDGEYRPRLIRWHDLANVRGNFIEIWNDINEYIAKSMDAREWTCYTNHFASHIADIELDSIIKTELFPVMFLSAAWFITVFNEIYNISETHMNENFRKIMLKKLPEDKKYFANLIKKYTEQHVENFKLHLTTSLHKLQYEDKQRIINMGFKMTPLNLIESEEVFDLRYKPWREIYIGYASNNLIMNAITPGLSILSNWYFIRNIRKGMFDNTSQYERMKNSELARDIIRQLYNAQRGTYTAIKMSEGRKEKMTQYINSKFKRLSDKIDGPIDYAIEEIIMSDCAIISITENIGRTIADIFTIIEYNSALNTAIGKPLTDGGYEFFAKYMFEICYTLLCLNKRLGVIHGDLHLNNATIGLLYQKPVSSIVEYICERKYYFKNHGYFGGVIDFSRAMMLPDKIDDLDNPMTPLRNRDDDRSLNHESDNMLDLYLKLYPGKVKIRDKILYTFELQFEAAFKLMTAIDIFMFVSRLSILLQKNNSPSKRALHLLDTIHRTSETFITSEMNHLIEQPDSYAQKVNDNPWPNEQIIHKCFSEFEQNRFEAPITDSYNIDNERVYDVNNSKKYPEGLTTIVWEEGKKRHNESVYSDIRMAHASARDVLMKEEYENVIKISHEHRKTNQLSK